MDYSSKHYKALAIAPKVTAALSFFCVLSVLTSILCNREKLKKIYHRLVFMTCVNELIRSINFFIGTWAMPTDLESIPYARGSELTCHVQAFVTQMGVGGAPMYIAALCIYAFVSVRYDFKEERIAWIEKWIHLFIICTSVAFAVIPLVFEFAGPAGSWCATLPPCPDDNKDMIGCTADMNWLRVFTIMFTTTLAIIVSAIMIISILFIERRKRKEYKYLKGKKVYIENYRQIKSSHYTMRSTMLLLGTIVTHCFVLLTPFLPRESGFHRQISYDILMTLSGLINTIIYTRLNNHVEVFNTMEFSLRRSMTGDFNYRKVTGGFRPKKKRRSFGSFLIYNSDFGIYMGNEDENDDVSNEEAEKEKNKKKEAEPTPKPAAKPPNQSTLFSPEDLSRVNRILNRSTSDVTGTAVQNVSTSATSATSPRSLKGETKDGVA